MASVELAVLLVVLFLGLFLGGFIPWLTLLLNPGQPPRGIAHRDERREAPRWQPEQGAGRALAGAFLAILAATFVVLLLVPGSMWGLPSIDDVPGGAFTISFAVLIVAVAFALPHWLGVRR
jgi:hypothetical protein